MKVIKRTLKKIKKLKTKNISYCEMAANEALSYMNKHKVDVLVVGCNRGNDIRNILKFKIGNLFRYSINSVDGVDVIDDVGNEFKHPKVNYYKQSAMDMNLPNNHYDLVFCFATMEHITNIELAFKEFARVTKSGGIIYCLAAPLWYSQFGHHKHDLFKDFPWIHLLNSEDQIIQIARDNNITPSSLTIEEHVKFMLNPKYFNMTPSREYIEVCERLEKMKIIKNELRYDKADVLTDELKDSLERKGYSADELLPSLHLYIGEKY